MCRRPPRSTRTDTSFPARRSSDLHSRELQAAAFARALAANGSLRDRDAAAGFAFLMAGASRALIMEQGLGVAAGHDAARSLVEAWLQRVEGAPSANKGAKPRTAARRTRR